MQREVFDPLGMSRTTYEIDPARHENVAALYQLDGTPSVRLRWTNTGAASIYSSASDMVRLLLANLPSSDGRAAGRGVLEPDTVAQMREPHASVMGMSIWGMGPILLAPNNSGGFVIGGAGIRARPAINADVRINPATQNGIVVLQTGNRALATDLASEWTFWETGKRGNGETGPDDDASGRGDDGTKHRCRMAHDRRWRPAARLADEACDESPTGVTPLQLLENWRRRPDSNWRIEVLQTSALTTWLRRPRQGCNYKKTLQKRQLAHPALLTARGGPR